MRWVSRAVRRQARAIVERYSHRVAGRMLTIFPDDSFLVSYPKSGSTWLRFLIATLLCPDVPMTFLELEKCAPDIYLNTNYELLKLSRPRVLKSHECFDPRYKKVVYIVRDPRDAAVSSYYYHLKRREIPDAYPIDSFVSRWLTETQWDSPRFGTWREHVLSWTVTRGNDPGFLLIRYEDMKENLATELGKVALFLGIDAAPAAVARASELSSAERMRALEREQHELWRMTKGFRPDVLFIRNATAGGWKSVLPEAAIRDIESVCGALMVSLGYELASKPVNVLGAEATPKSAGLPALSLPNEPYRLG